MNLNSSLSCSNNSNQKQLIDELMRLNQTLKTQLQKCHKYIQCLENDLKENQFHQQQQIRIVQLNPQQQNINDLNAKTNEIQILKQDIQKIYMKYKAKKHQVKKLQTSLFTLQANIKDLLKQKESYIFSLNQIHNSSILASNRQIQKTNQLESIIQQQKQTIQLYSKQLANKSQVIGSLQNVLEEFSKRQKIIISEKQQLYRTNQKTNQKLEKLEIQYKQNKQRLLSQLNQSNQLNLKYQNKQILSKSLLHSRNFSSGDLISTQSTLKDNNSKDQYIKDLQKKIQILERKSVWPVTKRISSDEYSILKQTQMQKQKLQQHIDKLNLERNSEKQIIEKLKNDLIQIKLDHSNIISQKMKLVEENVRLQRDKSQLLAFVDHPKTIQKSKFNNEIKNSQSIKKPLNRTFSISSIHSGQMTPKNDDQIPVKDLSNTLNQYVCMTNNIPKNQIGNVKKGSLFRQNSLKPSLFYY